MSSVNDKKLELIRLRKEYAEHLRYAFDAWDLESRPTPIQEELLKDTVNRVFWVLGGNRSGKSTLGGNIVAWWFLENHPYMERPQEWGTGPLTIVVVGRVGSQIENELWTNKIKPFLEGANYKANYSGISLQSVVNKDNGNRIIFHSHHSSKEAREKVQAYTSHIVWLDEMPGHVSLVTELLQRISDSKGFLYATFTPLVRNEEIRKIVDSDRPHARKVFLHKLDNPKYAGREKEVEAETRADCASEAEFRARMFGEWYYGDTRVFNYLGEKNKVAQPPNYDPALWRHAALLDPAASGLAGLILLAENPEDGNWFVMKAKYLKGMSAFELYDEVEKELKGYRITHRWCDCNPAGFYKESIRRGEVEWLPYNKQERKTETIDSTNDAFREQWLWLTELASVEALEEELVGCEWKSQTEEKIINASKYHLADPLRYFVVLRPKFSKEDLVVLTPTQELRQQWKRKKRKEEKAREEHRARLVSRRSRLSGRSWHKTMRL